MAEVKGYLQLPAPAKDTTLPIFRWRPWPNAKALDKTREKVSSAVGDRRFGIGLDETKRTESTGGASGEFRDLFNPEIGFRNFYEFVGSIPRAIPVMRESLVANQPILIQAEHVLRIDRGALWLIDYPSIPSPQRIADVVNTFEDLAVVIDAGWGRDVLIRQPWAASLVRALTEARPELEIVVCASSFPKDFTRIIRQGDTSVEERQLFGAVSRLNNAARLTYGDWGSTRPPEPPTPMGTIPRRIDVPFVDKWRTFRQVGDESYPDLASRAISADPGLVDLKIWGTYAIESTAQRVAGAINSGAAAAAARINIHLYRQAQLNAASDISEGDEPYTD